MQGNDISNRGMPTVIVVFDNLIARRQISELKGRRRKILTETRWVPDNLVIGALHRLSYTGTRRIEIVEFCDEIGTITALLDRHNLPYASITHTHPDRLAASLAYRPDVVAVYHATVEHAFKYGARGRLVTPPTRSKIGTY